jgi:myosin XV
MSQIQRERESMMVYQPKVSEKEKKISAAEKATFKSHMFSQKEIRERKTSSSTIPSNRDKFEDNQPMDEFTASAIPKPVLATPMLKTPSACLTYNARVPWKLRVKKEVFRPTEGFGPPAAIDLLFAQIVTDVFGPCMRMSQQEKRNATSFLNSHGVENENMRSQVRNIVKRQLIEMARSWPLYFARLFVVNGSPQYPDVTLLAVHHTGVFLARKENETLVVSRTILFEDLQSVVSVMALIAVDCFHVKICFELRQVTLPRPAALQLALRNGNRFVLHASKASAIQSFLQSFLHEFNLVSAA